MISGGLKFPRPQFVFFQRLMKNLLPSSILREKGHNRALIGSKTGRKAESVP